MTITPLDRIDPLRLHVIWDPAYKRGEEIASLFAHQFDALGMVRDRKRIGVPVRIRYMPLANGAPRPIDWNLAANHLVVYLAEGGLLKLIAGPWKAFHNSIVAAAKKSTGAIVLLPVAMTDRGTTLPGVTEVEPERFYKYADRSRPERKPPMEPGEDLRRLLLVALNRCGSMMRQRVGKTPGGELAGASSQPMKVFLSHAHRDGRAFTEAVDRRLRAIAGERVGMVPFLDSQTLVVGDNYRRQFEETIRDGMFIAIHTDDYGTRRWCRWEMLCAKRHHRPIVVAQMLNRGENRSFPYAGNTPLSVIQAATEPLDVVSTSLWKRVTRRSAVASKQADAEHHWLDSDQGKRAIDNLLISISSEALRFLLFVADANRFVDGTPQLAAILPRPPELADLAALKRARREAGLGDVSSAIIYPDPPLDTAELELIDELSMPLVAMTISQYAAARVSSTPSDRPPTLRPDLLADRVVGISLSSIPAEDSARLGFPRPAEGSTASWQALAEIVTVVAQLGGRIGYGGDMRDLRLFEEVADAYRSTDMRSSEAYINYLGWSVWSRRGKKGEYQYPPKKLWERVLALRGLGEVRLFLPSGDYLSVSAETVGGSEVELRSEAHGISAEPLAGAYVSVQDLEKRLYASTPVSTNDEHPLTTMRRSMASDDWLRVLIGGRVAGSSGDFPGAMEEAIEAIRAGKLALPLAAFGGSSLHTAHALGLLGVDPVISHTETGRGFEKAISVLRGLRETYDGILKRYRVPKQLPCALAEAESPETVAVLFRQVLVLGAGA